MEIFIPVTIFFLRNSKNIFCIVYSRQLNASFTKQKAESAWQESLLLSARRCVIRFLLERNISYRRSRCVDSLIWGDKYRRDTSLKNSSRRGPMASRVVRQESETNGSTRSGGSQAMGDRCGSILVFGGPHSRERHPSIPRGVCKVIVCIGRSNVPTRPFRLTLNRILTSDSH